MTSEQEPQGKRSEEATKPLSLREYIGVFLPPEPELTEKEEAERAANPKKALSLKEYIGAILPQRKRR